MEIKHHGTNIEMIRSFIKLIYAYILSNQSEKVMS